MSSRSFIRKLQALEYPEWSKFNITKLFDIKTLVVWLEQTKIRELKKDDRKHLKNTKNPNWINYFGEYLNEMNECPYQLKANMNQNDWIEIIEWLVSQAIHRTYEDGKEEFNRRTPIRRIKKREYALTGCESKETEIAMDELCKYLNIPRHNSKMITAQTLYTFIKTKFSLSSIQNYEATLDNDNDDNDIDIDNDDDAKVNVNKLRLKFAKVADPYLNVNNVNDILKYYSHYLGFTTGNKYVDAAAIILRVLYILDVRQSQNQLNEIVTFLQKFTANPKTNPNLGKVGT